MFSVSQLVSALALALVLVLVSVLVFLVSQQDFALVFLIFQLDLAPKLYSLLQPYHF